MGKGKKRQEVQEPLRVSGRRRFLIVAGAALATAGVAYGIWPRDETPLRNVTTLGSLPITYRSGKGRSVIYITQKHPHTQTVMAQLNAPLDNRFFQNNIDDVLTAAFEAYDRHGIKAMLFEGIFAQTVQQYEKQGHVRLVRRSSGEDAYLSKVESLINSRKWTIYPDSQEAIERLVSVERPIMDVFNHQLAQYKADVQREKEWLLRNLGKVAEAQARADAVRADYQHPIDNVRREYESAVIDATYHARDRSVLSTAKNALQVEPGILVVYGYAHASTLRETAHKQGIPFIAAEDPQLLEETKGMSIADLVKHRYLLPRFRLAQ